MSRLGSLDFNLGHATNHIGTQHDSQTIIKSYIPFKRYILYNIEITTNQTS